MTEQVIDSSSQSEQPSLTHQTNNERIYSEEEVNRIAGAKKNDGYNKGYKDAMAQFQAQASAQVPQQNYGNQSVGGIQQLTPDAVQQMIAEHHQNQLMQYQQAQEQERANQLAQTYFSKLNNSKSKYPDFDDVIGSLNYNAPGMAHIIHMATNADNTGDIMYDLRKNPEKLANLMILAQHQPAIAQQKIADLSASIKQNEAAQNVQMPDEPLSQNKPSNVGTDTGKASLRDLKLKYRG